jgi:glycosyltransferase involved in cell wall biosynthesis
MDSGRAHITTEVQPETILTNNQRSQLAESRETAHRQTSLIHQVFDLIPQLHRRELEARRESRSVRESPEYKLGKIVMDKLQSRFGWIRLPFQLKKAYEKLRAAPDPTRAQDTAPDDAATIFFHAGKTSIGMPLTLAPQLVSLPAERAGHAVWATFLGTSGATIEISVKTGKTVPTALFQAGDNIDSSSARNRFDLKAGAPVLLMDVGETDTSTTLQISRAKGEFGLLKLDKIPRIGKTDSSPSLQPIDAASSIFDISLQPQTGSQFAAAELERKLWGGYARYAIPELEKLKLDPAARTAERERAAWYLARWFFVDENFLRALENLRYSAQLRAKQHWSRRLCEIQCLVKLGRFEQAHEAANSALGQYEEPDVGLIRATTVRHLELSRGKPQASVDETQLAVINEFLSASGLATVQKRNKEQPLSIANLHSQAEPRTLDQRDKVSVVIPAYNAAEGIEWVLDSILEQTWRNLEVIVVDDFSSDATCDIVESIARRDPRVRLIRKTANEGAYPTRNAGMKAATGDFVMVHDSDDWSHPQRVELQLEALRKNPKLVATKSHWTRVTFNLEVWGTWRPIGSLLELNYSSLLFRRELLDKLGFWDEVRVSGDEEFYFRLRATFGEDSVHKLPQAHLLALSLIRDNSLTRLKATHLRSLFYGLRWSYRDSYLFWHSRAAARNEPPVLAHSAPRRKFPVPLGNRPGPKITPRYHLIVIADFARDDDASRETLRLISEAKRRGLRIAAFHWQRYDLACRTPLQPQFYEACLEHSIDIITPGDSLQVDVAVIGCSLIFQHRIDPLPDIAARKVIVCDRRNTSPTYHPDLHADNCTVADSHIESIFGIQATWVKDHPEL